MRVFFRIARSQFLIPGPRRMFRPELPIVPEAGTVNAERSKYRSIVGASSFPDPMRFGRRAYSNPTPAGSGDPSVGVNGNPDWYWTIPSSRQPPANLFTNDDRPSPKRFPFPKGSS